jgi:SAM-dependent methyltransferase
MAIDLTSVNSNYWTAIHDAQRLALHATIYTWAADQTPPGWVLDLGCEYGFGSLLLAETNPMLQVLGLDLDLAALQYSQNLLINPGRYQLNADASMLPIASESLSGAYLINILHMVKEPGQVLSEVRRTLKAGGVAIISIPGEDPGKTGVGSSRLIQDLEAELRELFFQVMYPQEIYGQIPSFPPKSFPIGQQASSWVACCWKC